MKGIVIRKAVLADLEVLLGFERELVKAERPFDSTIRKGPVNYYDLKAYISDPEVELLVAEYGGRVISSGYGMAKPARPYLDHKKFAYLGFMYTLPEFRGKGVNSLIIRALKAWAVTKGLREIRLTVYPANIAAINAYEKTGFEPHLLEMRLSD